MTYQSHPYYPRDRYDRYDRPSNYDYYYDPSHHAAMRRPNDSIEEIPRPYPPGTPRYEYGYGYPPPRHSRVNTVPEDMRRSHSMGGRAYYDDDYHRPHRHRRSRRDDQRRDRDRYSPPSSQSPPRRRRKSISDHALGALGLGSGSGPGAAESDRGRSRSRHHRSHSYSPSARGHKKRNEEKMVQAARAALLAGAVEAFRARKEPGEWTGEKGKRILTAAITSGAADGLVDKNPNKHSKRHLIESTLAGLATNHFVNGSRSRSRHGRRSSSHSGFKNVAATGALAAAGKEAYDRFRSRSRGRSGSRDSYDDDDASGHRGSRKRSKSVSDYINKGLAALGLDEGGDHKSRDRRGDRYDDYSDDERYSPPRRSGRRHRRSTRDDYSDDDRDVSYSPPRYRDSRR